MQISQSVRAETAILIILNLLMSFACIWIFTRMAPGIDRINAKNDSSLEACEVMLTALASPAMPDSLPTFQDALEAASNNISEENEASVLRQIRYYYQDAFGSGDTTALKATLDGINQLASINRQAMHQAANEAHRLGNAGAWGVVFMAAILLCSGLIFRHQIIHNLVEPIEEINTVISDFNHGDRMRRCYGADLHRDVEKIYTCINELIDHEGNP